MSAIGPPLRGERYAVLLEVAFFGCVMSCMPGCAATLPEVVVISPQCLSDQSLADQTEAPSWDRLHGEALDSLVVVPFEPTLSYDAFGDSFELPPHSGGVAAAVVGYPMPTAVPEWDRAFVQTGRSFVYDNALAAIAFAQAGKLSRAESLLHGLARVQREDGAWGFSFSARDDGFYNRAYVRAGATAWAAYAMGYYEQRARDGRFVAAAGRALGYLVAHQVDSTAADERAGLVLGGQGRWSPDESTFFPEARPDVAVTEHQIDAWFAFDMWASLTAVPSEAERWAKARDAISRGVERSAFDTESGMFFVGVGPDGPVAELALDSAGVWAALWLGGRGEDDKARRLLVAVDETFRTQDGVTQGYRPYAGEVADYPGVKWDDVPLVFVEGTLGGVLAHERFGSGEQAGRDLQAMRAVQCTATRGDTNWGLPYSTRLRRHFPTVSSAAATAWYAIVLGEKLGLDRSTPGFWQASRQK